MPHQRNVSPESSDEVASPQQYQSIAPILPVAHLERLNCFCPDAIPWVVQETTREAEFRRNELRRMNTFVFVERLLGMLAGLAIGSLALFTSLKLAVAGHDWVAGVVGGTTVIARVGAFIFGKSKPDTDSK